MAESLFVQFAQAAARSSAALRHRSAWVEFRRVFNRLTYGPVWEAAPPTLAEWEKGTVERSIFAPVLRAIDEWPESPLAEVPESLQLPQAFALLEGLYWRLRMARDQQAEPLIQRSLIADRISPEPLPADFGRAEAVRQLVKTLRRAPRPILATLLHGSLADGLVAEGFSDADVLCVIDHPDRDKGTFWEAARWLIQLNHYLLAVNPCMHHGPMVAFAAELNFCAEATLPSAVANNGVWIKGRCTAAHYHDGVPEAVLSVGGFEDFFERHFMFVPDMRSAFDVLWWVSSALFLPILSHQAEAGVSIYKRDCLDGQVARLPDPLWTTIRRLSDARSALGRWITERLPLHPTSDLAANPGEIVAEHRLRLAITPTEVRALGVTDAVFDEVRTLWQWVRGHALEIGQRYLGQMSAVTPYTWYWSRPATQQPERRTLRDYDDARRQFLDRCTGRDDVVAVFEFGEVGCPGLSDLDYCVVLADEVQGTPAELQAASFPPSIAYSLGHDPLFVAQAMLPKLAGLFPIFACRQIFGSPLELPLTASFPFWSRAAVVTQKNLRKYPQDLDWFLRQSDLDVRTALGFLHSTTHMIRSLEMLALAPDETLRAAGVLDADLRRRFAGGSALGAADIFAAIRACMACWSPLHVRLSEFWLTAADKIAANRGRALPHREQVADWLRTELAAGRAAESCPAMATIRPLISAYLADKIAFIGYESARGRTPSPYIEDPTAVAQQRSTTCTFFTGWHEEELEHETGSKWRWAMGEALLLVASAVPSRVVLSARTTAIEPQMVAWQIGDATVGAWSVPQAVWSERFSLQLDTDATPAVLRLVPSVPGRVVPPDRRKIAVALRDLTLECEAIR